MIYNREEERLKNKIKELGGVDYKSYMLINNYGYMFTLSNIRYDLRHDINCYGADIDIWSLTPANNELEKMLEQVARNGEKWECK